MAHGQMRFVSFRDRPIDPRDLVVHHWPEGFDQWLLKPENRRLYIAFEDVAISKWRMGYRYWNGRQIVDTFRCEGHARNEGTPLYDADRDFNINDHITPGMSRFFMARYWKTMPLFQLKPLLPSMAAERIAANKKKVAEKLDQLPNVKPFERHEQVGIFS